MNASKQRPPTADKPVTIMEMILYNMAGFSFNVYDTILYAWLPYFYLPPEGTERTAFIPLAALGIIMAGGRVLDAVTDPLVGYWSDHTDSKWGRRKPFIFVASPILFLAFILVWNPPVADTSIINAVYLAVVLFFYYIAYTVMLIPWFAVLPEMSPDNTVRTKVASIGVAIGIMGALVGGGLSGPLFESLGAFKMALVLGLTGLVAGELTLLGIHQRHEIDHTQETPRFLTVVKQVFADKQVLSFAIMIMMVQLTYQLMLMNVPYLTTEVLGKDEGMASMLMAEVIILIALSMPFWYWLYAKFPKRSVFRGVIVTMIVGFVMCFFLGSFPVSIDLFVLALLVFPVAAIPIGGVFLGSLIIIADLTDYDELKTGKRQEAIYYGIYGIVRKTGWALCSLILTGIFGWLGYSAENPLGIRAIWLVCAFSCLIGLLVFIPYKLGDSKEETKRIMGL